MESLPARYSGWKHLLNLESSWSVGSLPEGFLRWVIWHRHRAKGWKGLGVMLNTITFTLSTLCRICWQWWQSHCKSGRHRVSSKCTSLSPYQEHPCNQQVYCSMWRMWTQLVGHLTEVTCLCSAIFYREAPVWTQLFYRGSMHLLVCGIAAIHRFYYIHISKWYWPPVLIALQQTLTSFLGHMAWEWG